MKTISEDRISLGQRLREIRLSKGISTYRMQKGGVKFEAVQEIECPVRPKAVNMELFMRYLNILGIDLNSLI